MDSAVSRDASVNTFWFLSDGVPDPDTDAAGLGVALENFYDDAHALSTEIRSFLSSDVDPTNAEVKVYAMDDPSPRMPRYVNSGWCHGVGGTTLPHQVSVCLSYQAERVSGLDQARRRGRIYVGPLSQASITAGGVPSASFINSLQQAAIYLAGLGTPPYGWVVHSAAGGGGTAPVSNGWVDSSPDVQRRRKVASAVRSAWVLP